MNFHQNAAECFAEPGMECMETSLSLVLPAKLHQQLLSSMLIKVVVEYDNDLSHPLFTLQSMWETNLQSASPCQLEKIDTSVIDPIRSCTCVLITSLFTNIALARMLLRSGERSFWSTVVCFLEKLVSNFSKSTAEKDLSWRLKLSSTISKVSLLCFDNQPASAKHQTKLVSKYDVSAKQIAGVIQMVGIAKERGKALAQVLCYDLFDSSPYFYGDPTSLRCTKPDKEQLITELENNLNPSDFSFNSIWEQMLSLMLCLKWDTIQTYLYLGISRKPSRF